MKNLFVVRFPRPANAVHNALNRMSVTAKRPQADDLFVPRSAWAALANLPRAEGRQRHLDVSVANYLPSERSAGRG
jgi:hypothetical protein